MGNRELGSEFNLSLEKLTKKKNNVFQYLSPYTYMACFDSGRSALKHLASFLMEDEEILLPEFICESVINCFNKVNFYKVNKDFSIDVDDLKEKIGNKTKAIFLMHYFGHIQPNDSLEAIADIADENDLLIIEDTTHSIFSASSTIGDYQICSIRKWIPISGGGFLYSKTDKLNLFWNLKYSVSTNNRRTYGMVLKDMFLRQNYDFNEQYRRIFEDCERILDEQKEIYKMSDFSSFIAECVDVEELRQIRIKNYEMLKKSVTPAISLENGECPLVLPIRVKSRNKLRAYLMDNRIYCAVHWPCDNFQPENRLFARECANHLISLPIDQRYNDDDMYYLIEVLEQYGELELC
ncbi:aminotransferase class I/II-fold pyridoxal phosphate-dependent enzyme [Butyrivibrio sp. XPD2002]|uniref:aminotransferase class I/II-fold pyridoxal phosphate-dependent enzyme n=1 Tax=Butyrivibrio sp. XPD2002 TaxID=1280665 RepID=UPI000423D08C|nr:aminotransferase class I/II-fold pyridoxal phosphate-dependent enzyme [Butyrivibrio sp. XPD2002]